MRVPVTKVPRTSGNYKSRERSKPATIESIPERLRSRSVFEPSRSTAGAHLPARIPRVSRLPYALRLHPTMFSHTAPDPRIGRRLDDPTVETPAFLISDAKLEANLTAAKERARALGFCLSTPTLLAR